MPGSRSLRTYVMITLPRLSYGFNEAAIDQITEPCKGNELRERFYLGPCTHDCSRRRRQVLPRSPGGTARGVRLQIQGLRRSGRLFAAHTKGRFDCLITDLKMNGMSGLQLQQRLISIDPGLPIIFISAQSTSEERSQALRGGAVAFLNKPIDGDILFRQVNIALNRLAGP